MKILLVRHGETNYNKNRLIQGHSDIELNETGRNQATSAGDKLSGHNIDYAFSSPLKRAVETARLMLDNSNNSQNISKEITTDERLIEKFFGDFEGSTFDEYFSALESKQGLESVEKDEDVYERASSFFNEKYLNHKDDTILVVCHGALIRVFLRTLGLYPESNMLINNTALNVVHYDGQEFILEKFNI
ncbi:histidine phosphatase family protein [Gemella haemolysans]|uniref:histidine phosphatase family protein n=1 Tax=Gemella haemolysans TaxID=1379 RepID=UPI0028D13B09|nr:histidine phosphatase family protein [Gemella haemolysans]